MKNAKKPFSLMSHHKYNNSFSFFFNIIRSFFGLGLFLSFATDYMTGYGKVFNEKTSTEGAEYGSTEGAEYAEKGKACTPCGIQANP